MKNNSLFKMIIATTVVFALFALVVACGIYMKYMEYLEIGEKFTTVFWVNFNTNSLVFGISFLIFFALLYVNTVVLRNNLLSIDNSFSYLKKSFWSVIACIVVSVILSVASSSKIADTIMPYLNSQYFGTGDPVFYKDIGYYVFQRPFLISISDVLLEFSGFLLIGTLVLYLIFYGKFDFYNIKGLFKEKSFLVHTISLIIIYFILLYFCAICKRKF